MICGRGTWRMRAKKTARTYAGFEARGVKNFPLKKSLWQFVQSGGIAVRRALAAATGTYKQRWDDAVFDVLNPSGAVIGGVYLSVCACG